MQAAFVWERRFLTEAFEQTKCQNALTNMKQTHIQFRLEVSELQNYIICHPRRRRDKIRPVLFHQALQVNATRGEKAQIFIQRSSNYHYFQNPQTSSKLVNKFLKF